jgi:hypothetical protein
VLEALLLCALVAIVALVALRVLGQRSNAKVEAHAACIDGLECAGDGTDDVSPASAPAAAATIAHALPSHSSADADNTGSIGDAFAGFFSQGADAIKGIFHVALHPVETIKGLGWVVAHPVQAGRGIKQAIQQAWRDNHADFAGRAAFELATLPLSIAKAPKAARLAEIASETGVQASRVAKSAELAAKIADDARQAARASAEVAKLSGSLEDVADAAAWAKKLQGAEDLVRIHKLVEDTNHTARVMAELAKANGKAQDALDAELWASRARQVEAAMATAKAPTAARFADLASEMGDQASRVATWPKKLEDAEDIARLHHALEEANHTARVTIEFAKVTTKPKDAFDAEMWAQRAREAEEVLANATR